MIGKKNIVFGFFFLVLTAALGPLMILKYIPAARTAAAVKQQKIQALQLAQENGFTVRNHFSRGRADLVLFGRV